MSRFLKTLLVIVLLGLLAWGGAAWMIHRPLPLEKSPLDLTIQPGSTMREVSRQVAEAGVGVPPWQLTLLARLTQRASSVKAGSYQVEQGVSLNALLSKLTRGDVTQAELAIIEGWSLRQLRQALDRHEHLRHDTRGISETEIAGRLGLEDIRLEGRFFPDTYLFPKNSSDLDVLRRAYRAGEKQLGAAWDGRAGDVPLATPYEALVLASLVEKETGVAADRPLVASVFYNRLRQGMLLQTDPSVIYGLGDRFDGNLRKSDLLSDTPYNTYTRRGLPPTPIAMPGLAALRAVLHPPRTEWLYFVARGDGSSQFSRTLEEHNQAVLRFQKRRAARDAGR